MTPSPPRLTAPPDLRVGPLTLWVHGYEFEHADNIDDADWLRVTAHCAAEGASVEVFGSILLASELSSWRTALHQMHTTLSGEANLEPLEPNLRVQLTITPRGQVTGSVHITPNQLAQSHRFDFEIDPSHLPTLIAQLQSITTKWPATPRP